MNKVQFSLLLIGLFAVAALARTSPQIRRPFKFVPGQTYIYEYQGRQWNGVAKLAEQYAGLTLECDVIIQALPEQSGREVIMKLDDIKVEQLHTQTLESNDVRKLNQGQEQNSRQITMYKEELSKPIQFTYVDGKVLRFIAESSDVEWSINIKKSILSLFQLDLAPTKIIKSPTKKMSELLKGTSSEDTIRVVSEMPLVYPVYEESFGGICETLYEVDSADNVEQNVIPRYTDVLNVTKTVNYKNCLTDPSISYDRHSFDANTQTINGEIFSKQANVASQNYYTVPEEIKSLYSSIYTGSDNGDQVAYPMPVERYSYTKYNISTDPQWMVERRSVPVNSPADMSLIEGIYSESKIKFDSEGDVLISDTQQWLKLIACGPTSDLTRIAPDSPALSTVNLRQPTVQYETIQCELNAQKLKFYQALSKFAQVQQSIKGSQSALYSHKLILPFALSASWYPIVATGQQSAEESIEHFLDPEQLSKTFEQLLISLADDILTEDVAQSKKAGEKVVRLINIVSFLPKYKLAQVLDRVVERIQRTKQQQAQARNKQAIVDNDEVSKARIVRKLFLDTLPLAGSKQAIEMIEMLIESQSVKTSEAKELCEAVPANLRYPDTEIIDAFIRISQLPYVRKSRSLFASCSIAAGKMIGNAYIKSNDVSYKPTIYESVDKLPTHLREDDLVRQVIEEADPRRQMPIGMSPQDSQQIYNRLVLDDQDIIKYIKLYKQLLNKAQQYHEKVIFIETLAHMKAPQVLPILEPYITGRLSLAQCLGNQPLDIIRPTEPFQSYRQEFTKDSSQKDWPEEEADAAEECNYMRTIAIYALSHFSRSSPDKVQAMLMPVFDNTYEPYQIRIAAFTSMMLTPVPEHILERIASQMWQEPSKEVASFVVGTIDTMSKTTLPIMQKFKIAALKAADSMPKQYLDTWKFSWFAGGDHFDQQKQSGLSWVSEMIKSNVSSIPRGAYIHVARLDGPTGSRFNNILELGFTSKGLESLLRDYMAYNNQSPSGETNLIASIFENLYDSKDDVVKYYRQARDSIKESLLGEWPSKRGAESFAENFYFKRLQPIEGVNSPLGKQARQASELFESGSRTKRSITFQARTSTDDDEEPKMTLFAKLFDQTSYHALDKKEIISLLEKADDYIKDIAQELIMGGKFNYVKMIMPSNMWHMVPTSLGLPMIVTHRTPIIASIKIDGSQNGQLTSTKISQYLRQEATGNQVPNVLGHNFATLEGLNITAMVHPKIMRSNFHFMFAVEQSSCDAYGVQVEKSHQLSFPMEVSIAHSRAKQLVSLAIQPKTPARNIWTKEAAKTFIGKLGLIAPQLDNWLGQEQLVRIQPMETPFKRIQRSGAYSPSVLSGVQSLINEPKDSRRNNIEEIETPFRFEHRFVQPALDLEFYLEGASDDVDIIYALNKPELSKNSRGQIQMTNTEDIDDLDQHSKSGPFSDYLHLFETALTRPSKYLEFYTTLKPQQTKNQSPVYRFDFVLNNKQQTPTRRTSANRLDVKQIELLKAMEQQNNQQKQVILDVF